MDLLDQSGAAQQYFMSTFFTQVVLSITTKVSGGHPKIFTVPLRTICAPTSLRVTGSAGTVRRLQPSWRIAVSIFPTNATTWPW